MNNDWSLSSGIQTPVTLRAQRWASMTQRCRKYFLAVVFSLVGPVLADERPAEVLPATVIHNRSEAIVLDVRTPDEFAAGHIDSALNINIDSDDFTSRIGALDPDRLYVVHCGANIPGGRAERALAKLQKAGFTQLKSLQGGYRAWVNAGGVPVAESSR